MEQFGKYRHTMNAGLHIVIPGRPEGGLQANPQGRGDRRPPADVYHQRQRTGERRRRTLPAGRRSGKGELRHRQLPLCHIAQLAQTTMRSEIGKIELDRTFSERDSINDAIVRAVDEASDPWGIKVTRYEIKDITPSEGVMTAMEQQVRAEREKARRNSFERGNQRGAHQLVQRRSATGDQPVPRRAEATNQRGGRARPGHRDYRRGDRGGRFRGVRGNPHAQGTYRGGDENRRTVHFGPGRDHQKGRYVGTSGGPRAVTLAFHRHIATRRHGRSAAQPDTRLTGGRRRTVAGSEPGCTRLSRRRHRMNPFLPLQIVLGVFALVVVVTLIRSIRIVPGPNGAGDRTVG